ncbi:MAG: hypothetical protein EP297_06340 [Gammaproteobacteria bacterium]|nr:MAG: hypothetical protein EP297_06340 [Gammaproteobacteria bacterium]
MPLLFSKKPGCHEAYLKRKYHNPFFADDSTITQEMVNAAHQQDQKEIEIFQESFKSLMERSVALKPNTESEIILKLKEDIDKLYEQCAGLAGDHKAWKRGLKKLVDIVMEAIKKGAGNDTTALSELAQEEIARAQHYELLEYPLVAHLLRPDSPIQPDELATFLLAEEEETVTQVLSLFDPEHISALHEQAIQVLSEKPGITGLPYADTILALIKKHIHTQGIH